MIFWGAFKAQLWPQVSSLGQNQKSLGTADVNDLLIKDTFYKEFT